MNPLKRPDGTMDVPRSVIEHEVGRVQASLRRNAELLIEIGTELAARQGEVRSIAHLASRAQTVASDMKWCEAAMEMLIVARDALKAEREPAPPPVVVAAPRVPTEKRMPRDLRAPRR